MRLNEHSELVNQVILAAGSHPDVRVWKNSTGVARTATGHMISYGLKGSPDIIGIYCQEGMGIFLGIECKTGGAVLSTEQKNFKKMVEKMGGIYILARSIYDVAKALAINID